MRIFIFSIYYLLTSINCSPIYRNTGSSSSRVRILYRAPSKQRNVSAGPRIDFPHPVVQPSVPLMHRQRMPPQADDRIYFPDEEPVEISQKVVVARSGFDKVESRNASLRSAKVQEVVEPLTTAPQCSDGSTFCENVDTYPYATVSKILQNLVHKDFFGLEEHFAEPWNRLDDGGGEEEKYMCQTYSKIIRPQTGKTIDGKWKYIINLGNEEYVQAIKVEICRNANRPCEMSHNFPRDVVTSCVQKYMNRRLLSISNRGTPEPDIYSLPSGCSCSYKKNPNYLTYLFSRN